MSERHDFEGTVVRIEPGGFGVVVFDEALGANTHGVFSSTLSDPGIPYKALRPGTHVRGTAEVDEHELAAIKSLEVTSAAAR